MYICKFCSKSFSDHRALGGHTALCKLNPNQEITCRKAAETRKERYGKRKYILNCRKCGKEYVVLVTMIKFERGDYRKFCSRSCANSRIWSEEDKLKKSLSAKKSNKVMLANKKKRKPKEPKQHRCKYCETELFNLRRKVCDLCRLEYYSAYRPTCRFTFSLSNYSEWFDFSELEKYGMYSPTNRGNNLNGVSRDHLFSVSDGFKLKISPEIISHPANCRLIIHRQNNKKHSKSSITYSELLKEIEKFEKLYG